MKGRIFFGGVVVCCFITSLSYGTEEVKPVPSSQGGGSLTCADPLKLLDSLEKRRLDLDQRGQAMELREAEVKRLEEQLGHRIEALETLRSAIQQDLSSEKNQDDANIARLSKIFAGMNVKGAAASLEVMDEGTAVRVLKGMREKVAAKILSRMNTESAVRLADILGMPLADKRGQQ
ncbi:MAG: hypothetical protein H7832_10420 [Magnetococcus sp. DMHC-6]